MSEEINIEKNLVGKNSELKNEENNSLPVCQSRL